MDKNNPCLKKGKPHHARPYDRPNQSILGKVASKVKGLFNSTWLFNALRTNEEVPATDSDDEAQETSDSVQQVQIRSSKRPRLKLVGEPVNKLTTQAWLQPGTSKSFYCNVAPPTLPKKFSNQSEMDEQPVINGDDHSDNSEGSASTSGCSSLVSSHKERTNNSCLRLSERTLQSLSGELKAKSIFQQHQQKDRNSFSEKCEQNRNTSLWSCATSNVQSPSRSPSIMQSTKPSFNFATFSGPSKINTPTKKMVSSPFYEGKTTFGGASSIRRMPLSVAPYQTEKALRNKVYVKENLLSNNSECMSSAAKRILQTLEKMSTPVLDAKKIPNTSHSPVDLSIYLTPPSHRKNAYMALSKQTPKVPNKGPPIANINTLTKLTTVKNVGPKRHEISMEIPFIEKRNVCSEKVDTSLNIKSFQFLSADKPIDNLNKTGGGKIKSNLNQRLHFSSKGNIENEFSEQIVLPEISLPITSLPNIQLDIPTLHSQDTAPQEESLFTFASPIIENPPLPPPSYPKANFGFTFSSPVPIDANNSKFNSVKVAPEKKTIESSTELYSESVNDFLKTFLNSYDEAHKQVEEKPDESTKNKLSSMHDKVSEKFAFGKSKNADINSAKIAPTIHASLGNSEKHAGFDEKFKPVSGSWECSVCMVRNNEKDYKCVACTTPKPVSQVSNEPLSQKGFGEKFRPESGSWECSMCMIRNKENNLKCVACETPNPKSGLSSQETVFKSDNQATNNFKSKPLENDKSVMPNSFTFMPSNTWECDTCLVRSPLDATKCIACETLRPFKDNTNLNSSSGFKFSVPAQNSPIAFKFGSSAPQQSSNFNCGLSSSNSDSPLQVTQTLTVTPSGFKVETKDPPQAASFGGFVLNSLNEKKEDLQKGSSFLKQDNENMIFNEGQNKRKPDFNIVPKFSTETAKQDSSKLLTAPENSIKPNIFSATIVNVLGKKDSAESNVGINKQLNLPSLPPAKTSESFLISGNNVKAPDSSVTSTAPVFDNLASKDTSSKVKDTSNNFFAPKTTTQLKTGNENVKENSSVSNADKNNFKFVVPLPVPASKPIASSTFGSSSKTETNTFAFIDNSKTVKTEAATKSNVVFSPTSFSTVNSIHNFKFSDTSTKTTSSVSSVFPSDAQQSKPSVTFQNVAKDGVVEVSAPSFSSLTTTSSFTFSTPSATTSASSTPSFSFFPSTASSNPPSKTPSIFTFGATPSASSDQSKSGGFIFKGLSEDKPNPLTSNTISCPTFKQDSVASPAPNQAPAAVSSAPPVFKFGASVPSSSGGFVFGSTKTDSQSSVATPFVFGSNAAPSVSTSTTTFPVFPQSQPAAQPTAPAFQFGSVAANAATPAPAFGTQSSAFAFGAKSNAFAFGAKTSEPTNQMTTTLPQNPPPTFGCAPMQPVFGAAAAPTSIFGKSAEEKPQTTGFNFGSSVTPSPVFRFGASQDGKASLGAAAPGFSFGTPETPNSFSGGGGGFSMSTPPSFNFGSTSTPAGPFQFGAGPDNRGQNTASQRRIKRALRRGNRRE